MNAQIKQTTELTLEILYQLRDSKRRSVRGHKSQGQHEEAAHQQEAVDALDKAIIAIEHPKVLVDTREALIAQGWTPPPAPVPLALDTSKVHTDEPQLLLTFNRKLTDDEHQKLHRAIEDLLGGTLVQDAARWRFVRDNRHKGPHLESENRWVNDEQADVLTDAAILKRRQQA